MEKSTSIHTICRILMKELRQERNVQQAQISQLLGKSVSSWSKVESGDIPMTFDHLVTACAACQVWPAELLLATQNYMSLLIQSQWFVAAYGSAMSKEEDLLASEADAYYALVGSRPQTPSWGRFPVLQTPWPYPNNCVPLDVFRWALDPEFKRQMTAVN